MLLDVVEDDAWKYWTLFQISAESQLFRDIPLEAKQNRGEKIKFMVKSMSSISFSLFESLSLIDPFFNKGQLIYVYKMRVYREDAG